ncbi:MAG: hypothetical protein LIP23_07550 [Planctomycetes bacterium]|nr:hypothetical protein [Planctomycetota bacterium]
MYIGLDVGTSGCKAAVVRPDGSFAASAHREYPLLTPQPGWAELDPVAVWQAVIDVLSPLAPAATGARYLAVSSLGESMVMTDADQRVTHNAITYMDCRAESSVQRIAERIEPRQLHAVTGMPLNQMYSLNKLIWFSEHKPEVLEKTASIMMFGEFVNFKLTGRRLLDPASAARTLLFDSAQLAWSRQLFDLFALDRGWFGPIAEPGTAVGVILPEIAGQTGLPVDLTVILGCHDQPSGTLGSGTLGIGDTLLTEGSSEGINMIVGKDRLGDALLDNGIAFEPFFRGNYFITAGQLAHGHSIRWFADAFGDTIAQRTGPGESRYQAADRFCADCSGQLMFLPYLAGVDPNDADNHAKGCFVGLDASTDLARMYRALLEGLSFETRMRLERLAKSGVSPATVTAAGGAARSDLFMQLKADVLQRDIRVLANDEAGITGLAMICAVAAGHYDSYEQVVAAWVKARATVSPTTDYARQYRNYVRMQTHMRELYREME